MIMEGLEMFLYVIISVLLGYIVAALYTIKRSKDVIDKQEKVIVLLKEQIKRLEEKIKH
jgi:predicted permease|tara:strand:+ start:44 stop:220 length:177 start_codon:yes stop_codon:yes gene_type:complete